MNLPASLSEASQVSSLLFAVTNEFIKQLGTLGLLSKPEFALSHRVSEDEGIAVGMDIVKGLLNLETVIPPGYTLLHPNPALMVDPAVVTSLIGDGEGPLPLALGLQGPESVAFKNLFQRLSGLSAIFDEKAVADIVSALVPVISGNVKDLPGEF